MTRSDRLNLLVLAAGVFLLGCSPPAQTQPMTKTNVTNATALATFGGGCFWCTEAIFEMLSGVGSVTSGYAGGDTAEPTYKEVCGGTTGHAEVIQVAYDPTLITYEKLLETFWEAHDPTQGMRQGNDVGTQYRSGIYTYSTVQRKVAIVSRDTYQRALTSSGHGNITTEIVEAPEFYFAEEYHQQYLAKNPSGYCGLGGTGISCPTGIQLKSKES